SNGRDRTAAILGVAAGYDADEMRVTGVERGEPPGDPAAQRVVARAELRFDAEPVRGVDVSECLERDHVHVLQGLLPHGLAEVESKRIPDSAPAGDVRRRKRLVSQEQSADVVPAREVLCADDRLPTRSQDSLGLADEVIESLHMLDDLVR